MDMTSTKIRVTVPLLKLFFVLHHSSILRPPISELYFCNLIFENRDIFIYRYANFASISIYHLCL